MEMIEFNRAKRLPAPFWASRLTRVFSRQTYQLLLREYEFFRRHMPWERNALHAMELTGPRALNSVLQRTFAAPEVIAAVSRMMGIPVLPYVQAGFHFHQKAKPDGMIHHDYVYVKCGKPSPGLAPAMSFSARSKYARALTLLYYLGNDWADARSDGGTALYEAKFQPRSFSRVAYVPPVNNTALLFKNSPDAWHGFVRNRDGARRSIAIWYLAPSEKLARKIGVAPYFHETSIRKALEDLEKKRSPAQ